MAVRYRAPLGGINLGGRYFGPNAFIPAALAEPAGIFPTFFAEGVSGRLGPELRVETETGSLTRAEESEIRRERIFWGTDDEGNEIWTTATIVVPLGASEGAIAAALRAEIAAWLESHGGVT